MREKMENMEKMEQYFKVIDNYLMVKLPEEIDHHQRGQTSFRRQGKQCCI